MAKTKDPLQVRQGVDSTLTNRKLIEMRILRNQKLEQLKVIDFGTALRCTERNLEMVGT